MLSNSLPKALLLPTHLDTISPSMKRLFLLVIPLFLFLFSAATPSLAQNYSPSSEEIGWFNGAICSATKQLVTLRANYDDIQDPCIQQILAQPQNMPKYMAGGLKKGADGQVYSPGLLGTQGHILALLFENQPSSREYIADILDNIGIPTVSSAYAQGTGYAAMQPFLPIWKVFRNLAYSLYIIMFIVIGVMIMLRTRVNAQTIITIQSALPNLLITLILITFSYAIVGFMIDLMYFLIYFVVYLVSAAGLIDTPTKAIARLMNYSAWSVIFEGRNSIISAVSLAIGDVLSGLGTNGLELVGTLISWASPMYLIVAVAFAIAMLKLMFALVKSYVMLLIQLITAPVQILFNAMPGSKAFSGWLKRTASYLIPFPVAAAMFIFSAVLVGDPTQATILKDFGADANPFGVSSSPLTSGDKVWLPPFTLTGSVDFTGRDILVLVGFFVFLMTPTAVKMAQDWLQVKESPYTAEAFANIGVGVKGGTLPISWGWKTIQEEMAAKRSAKYLGEAVGRQKSPTEREGQI